MFEKLKANIVFEVMSKRRNIDKAYAMVPPTDSWYDTISTVHKSLNEILQLPHSMLEITSHDGLKLNAVYYPCENSAGATVIFAHGYSSHAEREWAFPGLFYRSMGYNLLIPYQRSHGPSEGKYISFGALEHQDMLRWVQKVNELHPTDSIVLHGLSMGGGIVLTLADKPMKNVKCLIADAPTISMAANYRNVIGYNFKSKREEITRLAIKRFEKKFDARIDDLEGKNHVAKCLYPLLLSAGSNEKMDDALAELKDVNPMDCRVLILPGCSHGNGMYKQTEIYQSAIREFLAQHIGK